MKSHFRALAESTAFQTTILLLILLTALLMGLETIPQLSEQFGDFFYIFFLISQIVFVLEILIRLLASTPCFSEFFKDGWNLFDFCIVLLTLVPAVGPFVIVARLLRILRVLRVFSTSDRMRFFIHRLYGSFDEVGYATAMCAVLGYIFSISGYYLFSEIDPTHWHNLGRSAISVFYLLLLQDVSQYLEPTLQISGGYILYFISFYVTFFGLGISVVVAALTQAQEKKE